MSPQVVQMDKLQLPPGTSKAALARVLARLGGAGVFGGVDGGADVSTGGGGRGGAMGARQPAYGANAAAIYSRKTSTVPGVSSQVRTTRNGSRSGGGIPMIKYGPTGSIVAINSGDSFMGDGTTGSLIEEVEVRADMGRRLRRDMRDEIVQKDHLISALREQLSGLQRRCAETEAGVKEAREEVRLLRDKNSKLRAATCRKSARLDSISLDKVNFETDPLALVHACAERKNDIRLTQLMKRLKNLEVMRDEAKAAAEAALASVQPLREDIQHKEEMVERACAEAESAKAHMRLEMEARKETERQLRRASEEKQRLQQQLSSREDEIEKVRTEAQTLCQSRSHLLGRTLKRDARIEALGRKLADAMCRAEAEEKARGKAEDDLLHLEERMRIIRKKSHALQSRLDQDAADRQHLQNELQLKEEECCLLVSMLSGKPLRVFNYDDEGPLPVRVPMPGPMSAAAREEGSSRVPKDDPHRLITKQQERIKQLEMDVARLSTIAIAAGNEAEVLIMAGVLPPSLQFSHALLPNPEAAQISSPPPWPPHLAGNGNGKGAPSTAASTEAAAPATAAPMPAPPHVAPDAKRSLNPFDASTHASPNITNTARYYASTTSTPNHPSTAFPPKRTQHTDATEFDEEEWSVEDDGSNGIEGSGSGHERETGERVSYVQEEGQHILLKTVNLARSPSGSD